MKDNIFIVALKGLVVGSSMLIPGVSGGTMAIILDIYTELIHALSSIRKNFKKSLGLLIPFCLGALIGIVLFSKLLLYLMESYRFPMMYLFLGAIIGSLPALLKKAEIKSFNFWDFACMAIGFLIVLSLGLLPQGFFNLASYSNLVHFIMLFIAGVIVAIALILPGISASYMLLILGLYDVSLTAIQTRNIIFIIPMGLGLLVGTFGNVKCLENAMAKHPRVTYLLIIGFVLGSILEVFPGFPGGMSILYSLLTFIAGLTVIMAISKS